MELKSHDDLHTRDKTCRGSAAHKLSQWLSYWHQHNMSFSPATENRRVEGEEGGESVRAHVVCLSAQRNAGISLLTKHQHLPPTKGQTVKAGDAPTEMLMSCCVLWKGLLSLPFGFLTSWQNCIASQCVSAGEPSCCNQFGLFLCFFNKKKKSWVL